MRRWRILSLVLLLSLALAGCARLQPPSGPGASTPSASSAPAVSLEALSQTEPALLYGRSRLSQLEQDAYDTLRDAVDRMQVQTPLPPIEQDAIARVMQALFRDHPQLFWLGSEYTILTSGEAVTLELNYTASPEDAAAILRAQEEQAAQLLQHIPAELSDFDKALLVHDRLIEHITYDREAPRPSSLSGALIDRRATCEGYARACQYLFGKLGIEALIVYGTAEEAHAWNILRLDGEYYLCDLTWDDVPLTDGGGFLSHEYLFRGDSFFSQTHIPYDDGSNYPLPDCPSDAQNYFARAGTLLSSADPAETEAAFRTAVDLAAAHGYTAVQVGLASPELAAELENGPIADGTLDTLLRDLCQRKGLALQGRAFSSQRTLLTYIVTYEPAE